jgi:hypothetical protein
LPRALTLAALGLGSCLLPGGLVAAAPGVSATAAVEAGGGHDDNMMLQVAPGGVQPATDLVRLGGPFVEVAPAVAAGLLAGGARLQARYEGDYRAAEEAGHLYYQEAELAALLPRWGFARLELGVTGGRFDASRFSEERFVFAGGAAGLRLTLGDSWHWLTRYRLDWRRLGGAAPSWDRLQALDARLSYAAGRLELGPRLSLLLVSPQADSTGRFRRARAAMEAGADLGPFRGEASVWAGWLDVDTTSERHLGVRAELRWPLGTQVELFAAADIAQPVSTGASQDYARRLFSLGLAVSWTARAAVASPPAAVDERPVVERDRVRFRLRAPAAAVVTVVGSWDEWGAPGARLDQTGNGLFELWMPLPAGSHRYHFLVDGQARRPPDAPRYAPDGFGGEDGVIEVEGSADASRRAPP